MSLALLWTYRKPIAAAFACILFVLGVLYVRAVFRERDELKTANQVLRVQLQDAAEMQAMQNRIAEAIAQIKIRSQVNVTRIESEPKPQFQPQVPGGPPAPPVAFIPGGLLQAVYSSAAADGTAPGHATGAAVAAAGPGG